jgi:hypothetical protein
LDFVRREFQQERRSGIRRLWFGGCWVIALNSVKALTVGSALFVTVAASPAMAEGAFAGFNGTWRGAGNITLAGGQKEKLTCKAYYNPKNAGSELGIALTCSSQANKIELRANLNSSGDTVSGSWEERAFNSSGSVAGKASGSKLNLSISGTLKGTMSISTGGSSQSVNIRTDGTGFKSVSLSLSKS